MLADGIRARFVRAGDKEVRDACIPARRGACTGNTVAMTMPDGMVIAISRTHEGVVHDIT